MTAKPLPPARRPGTIDLLVPADDHPSDPAWRADALGKSRHSRLADEVREPARDSDPDRAALLCARIAREVLGDYAPALLLLSPARRRRVQTLAAWTATLFDLALRPGLAGLDGDRLAQINAWEFQTEDALAGARPGQPIFVALAKTHADEPWPPEALDAIVAAARSLAVARGRSAPGEQPRTDRPEASVLGGESLARALLAALYGAGGLETAAAGAGLVARAVAHCVSLDGAHRSRGTTEILDARNAARRAPAGWRAALGYVRRVVVHKERSAAAPDDPPLGLAIRLRYLFGAMWLG